MFYTSMGSLKRVFFWGYVLENGENAASLMNKKIKPILKKHSSDV